MHVCLTCLVIVIHVIFSNIFNPAEYELQKPTPAYHQAGVVYSPWAIITRTLYTFKKIASNLEYSC